MRGMSSGVMPMPVSRTRMTMSFPSCLAVSEMWPPASVYFAALVRRFTRICSSLKGSASSLRPPLMSETLSSCFRSSMSGRTASTAVLTTGERLSGSFLRPIFPREMRETSSRSSISRERCFTCRCTTSFAQTRSSSVSSFPKSWAALLMADERVPELVGEHGQELVLPAVGLLPLGLDELLLRDVAADLRGPDDAARGVPDRRDGERDVDDGPVLPPPPGLVVVDLLAPADPAQDLRHVLDQLGRHEHRDVAGR